MATETHLVTSPSLGAAPAGKFWLRFADNVGRRWIGYLLPVLLCLGVGVLRVQKLEGDFVSGARLSVSSNPLVDDRAVRGTTIYSWETPAVGTARIMNEQLATDSFAEQIARGAELGDELDAGLMTLDDVRSLLSITSQGDTLVAIEASGDDPSGVLRLVSSTIDAYTSFILDTEVGDSQAAVDFYEELAVDAKAEAESAQADLEAYLTAHPAVSDTERPLEETLEIQRLSTALDDAVARVNSIETSIREAQLQVRQANSEAGQRIRVVDQPELPTARESTKKQAAFLLGAFGLVGLLVSAVLAIGSTATDKSVRFPSDVADSTGLVVVAAIPTISALKRRRFVRQRSEDRARAA